MRPVVSSLAKKLLSVNQTLSTIKNPTKISGFCCDVDENCALLGYYAASNGNPLLTFWNNVSVPLPFDTV
jgi:hypothetical protein